MHPTPPVVPGISDWRPLARGGFATVWQARQETLDRQVAVKVDERTLATESEQRRFLGEARAAGNLSGHPGIVTVHDAGILSDGRPYLVMKLCPGGSLTRWLRPDSRHSVDEILEVGIRIADALAAAHALGMLHRDVKPANILIDSYGHAGLADFGLAAASDPGSAVGMTLAYAPPEALRRQPPSEFGDVYQLAATLYALLSGHPPREPVGGRRSLEDLLQHLDDPIELLPDVDDDLMQVLLDGLSPVPTDRPTAAAFRDRLEAVGHGGAAGSVGDPTMGSPPVKRRRRLVLTLVAATVLSLLVVAVGGSGFYLYEIDRSVTANIRRGIELPKDGPGAAQRPVKEEAVARTLNYVLIGNDDGDRALDDGAGTSDSFMVVHLNAERDEAYIISIPYDTQVTVPGQGAGRMNEAYADRDPALVVRTLETLLGVRMDHLAMIDFQGFVNLTNDLGGVTVNNPTAFDGYGDHFPAGTLQLEGDYALHYVRTDDGLPPGLDRSENQRNVLRAILAKGLSAEVVSDPLKFTRFIGNAAKRIQVDNDLTDSELRSTALSLRLKPSDIKMLSMPLASQTKPKGNSARPVDGDRLDALAEALRTDTMADYVKKYPSR